MLSPLSAPATGIVPMLCPFLRHNEIFLSSPALATTKSANNHIPPKWIKQLTALILSPPSLISNLETKILKTQKNTSVHFLSHQTNPNKSNIDEMQFQKRERERETDWCGSTWLNWLSNQERECRSKRKDRRPSPKHRRASQCLLRLPPITPLLDPINSSFPFFSLSLFYSFSANFTKI